MARRPARRRRASPATLASPKGAGKGDGPAHVDFQALQATRCPFGPSFFLTQLGVFVRDRCPDAAEGLPAVELHLADGEVLDVCHVIVLAPHWMALAVDDRAVAGETAMRTEVVAYEQIARVTVRAFAPNSGRVGFTLATPMRLR